MLKKFINYWLDFVWPQFCLSCKKEGNLCCPYCLNDILLEESSVVDWPGQSELYFDSCHICCHYENDLLQKLLKTYKYSFLENLAPLLATLLEKQARRLNLPPDTIVTNVPLHKSKLKQRGFDQTEILAKKLSKRLKLKYAPLLKRRKNTKAQAQLSKTQRLQNVQGVFEAAGASGAGGTILLIDDVTTTGSTLNQAAKALQGNKVICLTIAKN